ncbi:MAG: Rossmann-like and DUF2520 domain-containing protein [Terriglobia bacterium]
MSNEGVTIVGPGRLGQALGRLLAEAGVPMRWVAARRIEAARRAVEFIGMGEPVWLSDPAVLEASVFLLTTADSAIEPLAKDLAARLPARTGPRAGQGRNDQSRGAGSWKGKVVLHTCGSLPSDVLAPLRRLGAAVGSLHPFQTVPSPEAGVRNLKGCYWGIEGDAAAVRVARRWVKMMGGRAFPVRADRKILYHAAAFLVCPTVVTLMERSARLLEKSGVPERIARPMLAAFVAETAGNFSALGPQQSLTGPVARGDWQTVKLHLAALRRLAPEVVPVYTELVRDMLRLRGRRAPPGVLGGG